MIPLRLVIEGVYSYQKRQEIDFKYLCDAGIFGIFGKVGSGKSSILEAITLALYGENERFSRNERNYNFTNLRSDSFLVIFEFKIDQMFYRFQAEGKRNRKQFEDIKVTRTAYAKLQENDQFMPIEDQNASRVLDLAYNDFKRTIIIPQGKFQEFLDLKTTERTAMMQSLFKLEKYNLGDKTKQLITENDLVISALDGELKGISEVSPEQFEEKKQELHSTKTLLTVYETDIKKLAEAEQIQTDLQKLFDELLKTTQLLDTLETQKEDFQNRAKKLERFREALQYIKPVLDKQNDRQNDLKITNEALEKSSKILAQSEESFVKIEQLFAKLKPEYDNRKHLEKQSEELSKLLTIKELEENIFKISQRIAKGQEALQVFKSNTEKSRIQKTETQELLNNLQENKPDDGLINELVVWFGTDKNLKENRQKIKDEADVLAKDLERLNVQKTTFVAKQLSDFLDENQQQWPLKNISQFLAQHRQTLLINTDELDPQKLKLQTQKALQNHANALADGQACPLCGSVHHPTPLSENQDLENEIKAIEKQQLNLKKSAEILSKSILEIEKLGEKLSFFENQKAEIKQRYKGANDEILANDVLFVWQEKGFDKNNSEDLNNALAARKLWQKSFEDALKRLGELDEILQKNEIEQKEKYEKPLENLAIENGTKIQVRQSLLLQITLFEVDDLSLALVQNIKEKKQSIDNQYLEIEKSYLETEKQFYKLKEVLITEKQKKTSLQEQALLLNAAITSLSEELAKALVNSSFADIGQVKEILALQISFTDEEKAINDFHVQHEVAKERYLTLREQSQGKVFEEAKLLEIRDLIKDNATKTKELNQTLGKLAQEVANMEKDLLKQAEIQKQRTARLLRADTLKTLQEMFRSNGFVNFASTTYLQNICNQANERFHLMTRQQLQLELSEGNEFVIRDLLNGGKTRSASSLSGGQKFQASLALALALADSSQQNNRQNFFFLDEGFGSLDKDALKVVFETLKSLRKENRIVGIISHVEELQHEIDRYLHIHNHEETGSMVKVV